MTIYKWSGYRYIVKISLHNYINQKGMKRYSQKQSDYNKNDYIFLLTQKYIVISLLNAL